MAHALNSLVEFVGPHLVKLLHSADWTSGIPNSPPLLLDMYHSGAHLKGSTVTVLHNGGDGGKTVGVYMEQPWSPANPQTYVSDLPLLALCRSVSCSVMSM
jgi:hypothetical protein